MQCELLADCEQGHTLQATVETVIKVSQKQQQEEEDEDDVGAEGSAANSTEILLPSIQQDKSAGSKSSAKSKSSNKAPAPSGSKQQKAKGKKVDSHAEKEVDRIIDSQDNEYVLSKPK